MPKNSHFPMYSAEQIQLLLSDELRLSAHETLLLRFIQDLATEVIKLKIDNDCSKNRICKLEQKLGIIACPLKFRWNDE